MSLAILEWCYRHSHRRKQVLQYGKPLQARIPSVSHNIKRNHEADKDQPDLRSFELSPFRFHPLEAARETPEYQEYRKEPLKESHLYRYRHSIQQYVGQVFLEQRN